MTEIFTYLLSTFLVRIQISNANVFKDYIKSDTKTVIKKNLKSFYSCYCFQMFVISALSIQMNIGNVFTCG